MIDMVDQQHLFGFLNRPSDRCRLLQNIDTIDIVFDHIDYFPDVALDYFQAPSGILSRCHFFHIYWQSLELVPSWGGYL
jgi:hypothetical protein